MEQPKKLEVEGGELLIKSSKGVMAVIPKDKANWVRGLIDGKRFDVLDKYVKGLDELKGANPKAEDGMVISDPPVKPIAPAESTNAGLAGSIARVNYAIAQRQAQKEQDYQAAIKDKTGAAEEYFVKRYNTSPHRYKYDTDPEYKKQTDKKAAETSEKFGSIDIPATDVRSRNYAGNPNLAFMTHKGMSKEGRKALEESNLEIIGSALPVPGLEAVGKIPSITKLGGKLLQGKKIGSTITDSKTQAAINDIVNMPKSKESSPEALVLADFKARIKTPEGKKRLDKLGITEEKILQELQMVDNPQEAGAYYEGINFATVNSKAKDPSVIARHEIEHAVQSAYQAGREKHFGTPFDPYPYMQTHRILPGHTDIDRSMAMIETWDEPLKKREWDEFRKTYDEATATADDKNKMELNYFRYGSEGREKSPYLGEVQQYMLDKKIIDSPYQTITIDDVKKAYKESTKNNDDIRLFNIMKPTGFNFALIRDNLSRMLSVTGAVGAGASTIQSQQENEK